MTSNVMMGPFMTLDARIGPLILGYCFMPRAA